MGLPLFSDAVAVRRTVPWKNADQYFQWPLEKLRYLHRACRKALEMNESSTSSSDNPNNGRDFWIKKARQQQLLQRAAVFQAHENALSVSTCSNNDRMSKYEDWVIRLGFSAYCQTKFLAHLELERIARRCVTSDTGALTTSTLSSDGFSIYSTRLRKPNLGKEHLDNIFRLDHREMRMAMSALYCPRLDLVWDPVLGGMNPEMCHNNPTLLFPYRSSNTMLKIFGCTSDSVRKADNGLFLPPSISDAIQDGVLAIVPDLGMEPLSGTSRAHSDPFERRFDGWMDQTVQDYQLIVIDVAHPRVQDTCKIKTQYGITEREIGSLHGHKLKFRTSWRPRASYVWWSFLSAALVASWRYLKTHEDTVRAAKTKEQVMKALGYWGKSAVKLLDERVRNGFLLAMGVSEEEEALTKKRDDLGIAVVAIERAYPMIDAQATI